MNKVISKKKEVIKHKGAITIENKISLLERKVWNVLLANAYYDLPNKTVFQMPLNDLAKSLEFDSHNIDYLKKSLKKLGDTKVEWNILSSNGKEEEWGFVNLLSYASIKKGICTYEYSQFLRERLYQPALYGRINLLMQNKFSGKYTLALYELLIHYIDSSRTEQASTEFITIDKYRTFMGASENDYKKFCDLKKRTITEPIANINKVSNIMVRAEYRKEGQVTVAVRFHIEKQSDIQVPGLLEPVITTKLLTDGKPEEGEISSNQLKTFFTGQDISLKTITGFRKQITERDLVPENLHEEYFLFIKTYCEKQSDIKSISGLFIKLLQTGEQSENFLFKVSEEQEKKKLLEKRTKEIYETKLKFIYEKAELKNLQDYFIDNEPIFLETLEKYKTNIMVLIAIKSNKGKSDIELVRNQNILQSLREETGKLPNYSFIEFKAWKKSFTGKEENKEILDKLLKDARVEAERK